MRNNIMNKIFFIIGPGGVGKSTCGRIVAEKLDFDFIDLDSEFIEKIGHIGNHIRTNGYADYCRKNSELFYRLVSEQKGNVIFVLSSGFLTYDADDLKTKHVEDIKRLGKSILLLPSEDLEEGMEVVVSRQLKRGFGLVRDKEEKTFRERYEIYKNLGDFRIFSSESPGIIVGKMVNMIG